MVSCDFPVSSPGLIHLSTVLIGTVCVTLGFMTHLHSSWVSKEEFKMCKDIDKYWRTVSSSDIDCPNISLETAFLIITVVCLCSSLLFYYCNLCCCGGSRSASLIYVIYLLLAAVALVVAGVLYIKSAILIARLPTPDFMPVLENMGRVLVAAMDDDKSDKALKLKVQSDEQTYYQEKLLTGVLTIINGILHVMCAWLAVLDLRKH